ASQPAPRWVEASCCRVLVHDLYDLRQLLHRVVPSLSRPSQALGIAGGRNSRCIPKASPCRLTSGGLPKRFLRRLRPQSEACWQVWPVPVALGQAVPARSPLVHLSLGGREATGGLLRLLGWLWLPLLHGGHVLHESTDGPGERPLVTIERAVIGGVPP